MKALVLEDVQNLSLRDIDIDETMEPDDVRIALHTVGVCGSDVHYFEHGRIGDFVVEKPMVLGHEASGRIIEVGSNVDTLQPGDRVCMEPGIPNMQSKPTRQGLYNLDPDVRFWATPPVHGVLRPSVVHPALFTYKLPESVSYEEGAMVEPVAIGMHAANKAAIQPGDIAVVLGAGTIGMVTALSALVGGCSHIVITDIQQEKLNLAESLGPITGVNVKEESVTDVIMDMTDGYGADIVFEASGSVEAASGIFDPLAPGGTVVLIGMPGEPVPYDVVKAQTKEARVEHVFRYANVYEHTLRLMGSGQLDVKPLLTDKFQFDESVEAFHFAADMPPSSVKVQIEMDDAN